jgi:glycine/D-amino acid oxidase-like deaminating enzyme
VSHWDAIVIGAGVIGTSVAYNLAALGAKRVLVLERSPPPTQSRRLCHQ